MNAIHPEHNLVQRCLKNSATQNKALMSGRAVGGLAGLLGTARVASELVVAFDSKNAPDWRTCDTASHPSARDDEV